MISVLASLFGFLTAVLPGLFAYLAKRQKISGEIEIARLKYEASIKANGNEYLKFLQSAADAEHKRLIDHDCDLMADSGIWGALRKSVRPVVTYLFLFLFCGLKVTVFINAMYYNELALDRLVALVWDESTQAIFAAVISFWFGTRAMERWRGSMA